MTEPIVEIVWSRGDEESDLHEREWFIANGVGGFSSGCACGIPTRRHHGIFVPNASSATTCFIAVPCIDEFVEIDGERINLGGADFQDERFTSQANLFLKRFSLRGDVPTWIFELGKNLLEKTILMPPGQNTGCVRYRIIEGPPMSLRLRIYAAARRPDKEAAMKDKRPFTLLMRGNRLELTAPQCQTPMRFKVIPTCSFITDALLQRDVFYQIENKNESKLSEHLYSPGYFDIKLNPDEETWLILSTESWETLEVQPALQRYIKSQYAGKNDTRLTDLTSGAPPLLDSPANNEQPLSVARSFESSEWEPEQTGEEDPLAALADVPGTADQTIG